MDVFLFILGIIAISTAGKVYSENAKTRRILAKTTAENPELAKKIVHLEERVQILERIVTDQRSQLADQINSLEK